MLLTLLEWSQEPGAQMPMTAEKRGANTMIRINQNSYALKADDEETLINLGHAFIQEGGNLHRSDGLPEPFVLGAQTEKARFGEFLAQVNTDHVGTINQLRKGIKRGQPVQITLCSERQLCFRLGSQDFVDFNHKNVSGKTGSTTFATHDQFLIDYDCWKKDEMARSADESIWDPEDWTEWKASLTKPSRAILDEMDSWHNFLGNAPSHKGLRCIGIADAMLTGQLNGWCHTSEDHDQSHTSSAFAFDWAGVPGYTVHGVKASRDDALGILHHSLGIECVRTWQELPLNNDSNLQRMHEMFANRRDTKFASFPEFADLLPLVREGRLPARLDWSGAGVGVQFGREGDRLAISMDGRTMLLNGQVVSAQKFAAEITANCEFYAALPKDHQRRSIIHEELALPAPFAPSKFDGKAWLL